MPARFPSPSLAVALLAAGFAQGCNDANFKTSDDKVATPESADLKCGDSGVYSADDMRLKIKDSDGVRMVVQGEFCPQAPAVLDLVFLVDFSLSMYNEPESRGNDQVKNDSCGRLSAASAIIDKYAQNIANENAEIKVAVVQFATEHIKTLPLTPLADAESLRTVENFCGGVNGTNYTAAFDEATKLLKDEAGSKVIYLISDGLPTEGGGGKRGNFPRHLEAAQKAADAMRAGVSNATFNAVFLSGTEAPDDEAVDPVEFLTKLTGSEERVKVADNAADLSSVILDLEAPLVDLDTALAQAVLKAEGVEDQPLAFESFAPAEGKEQVWVFRTAEFTAFPGASKESKLSVTAPDKTGQKYQLDFTIVPKAE